MKSKIDREKQTMELMIRHYCNKKLGKEADEQLCSGCQELLDYACERLDKCPFGNKKHACARCKIHCYRSSERQAVKEVMKVSAGWICFRHPVLALKHLLS